MSRASSALSRQEKKTFLVREKQAQSVARWLCKSLLCSSADFCRINPRPIREQSRKIDNSSTESGWRAEGCVSMWDFSPRVKARWRGEQQPSRCSIQLPCRDFFSPSVFHVLQQKLDHRQTYKGVLLKPPVWLLVLWNILLRKHKHSPRFADHKSAAFHYKYHDQYCCCSQNQWCAKRSKSNILQIYGFQKKSIMHKRGGQLRMATRKHTSTSSIRNYVRTERAR